MASMRVYEAARKLNIDTGELLKVLQARGIKSSPISTIDTDLFNELLDTLVRQGGQEPEASSGGKVISLVDKKEALPADIQGESGEEEDSTMDTQEVDQDLVETKPYIPGEKMEEASPETSKTVLALAPHPADEEFDAEEEMKAFDQAREEATKEAMDLAPAPAEEDASENKGEGAAEEPAGADTGDDAVAAETEVSRPKEASIAPAAMASSSSERPSGSNIVSWAAIVVAMIVAAALWSANGKISEQSAQITALQAQLGEASVTISSNKGALETQAGIISSNKTAIESQTGVIAANKAAIGANTIAISSANVDIAATNAALQATQAALGETTNRVANAETAIELHSGMIVQNRANIREVSNAVNLKDRLTVKAEIASNASALNALSNTLPESQAANIRALSRTLAELGSSI